MFIENLRNICSVDSFDWWAEIRDVPGRRHPSILPLIASTVRSGKTEASKLCLKQQQRSMSKWSAGQGVFHRWRLHDIWKFQHSSSWYVQACLLSKLVQSWSQCKIKATFITKYTFGPPFNVDVINWSPRTVSRFVFRIRNVRGGLQFFDGSLRPGGTGERNWPSLLVTYMDYQASSFSERVPDLPLKSCHHLIHRI